MKEIYIVRHAKAEGQPFHASLTGEGERQARQLASFLENRSIQAIYSSPFKRALDTIAPFADRSGLRVQEDDRLGERVLSDQDLPDWMEKLKMSFEDFSLSLPGGESNQVAMERARSFVDEVMGKEEEHIVCVSHGNLTTLLLKLFDESYGYNELLALSNPDVYIVRLEGDRASVQRVWE
ncbi:histidine phosphatase family protein [Rossellomorea vietnamensis]|uniref:histidine phosphatase family protein n=1 Tax=Rossellomorea TaxID=2837508 RepID=UPI001CCFE8EE|nr:MULTISPECIES: histidine phosphatase family protein [Rossellomorea]MCA0147709.1 histidine phosphatase family protein [Rossellomorea vietnamensis]UTE76245.1 histidine phosphatase family protein [Rossellomorea sp. KS-H15a]